MALLRSTMPASHAVDPLRARATSAIDDVLPLSTSSGQSARVETARFEVTVHEHRGALHVLAPPSVFVPTMFVALMASKFSQTVTVGAPEVALTATLVRILVLIPPRVAAEAEVTAMDSTAHAIPIARLRKAPTRRRQDM